LQKMLDTRKGVGYKPNISFAYFIRKLSQAADSTCKVGVPVETIAIFHFASAHRGVYGAA